MNHATREQLIAFETRVAQLWRDGQLPFLTHLCGGNEDRLIEIFSEIGEGDWIFSTHRSHYHALLAGMDPEHLLQEIRCGRSMFLFDAERRFFTSSILAGCCGIAAGVAHGIAQRSGPENVWCFLGDGAEENGHFAEAVMHACAHRLNLHFIIEDNDRQVDTTKGERRGGHHRGGTGFVMPWPESHVTRYAYKATFPHAGDGSPPGSITFKNLTPPRP